MTGLDSTTPKIGVGVTIVRGLSLDRAEYKIYYPVVQVIQNDLVQILYKDENILQTPQNFLTFLSGAFGTTFSTFFLFGAYQGAFWQSLGQNEHHQIRKHVIKSFYIMGNDPHTVLRLFTVGANKTSYPG